MEWATCIAVIYSITDRASFTMATTMLEDIIAYQCYRNTKNLTPPCLAVIANKRDLEHLREIPNHEGKSLAKKHGAGFWEVSASEDYHSTFGPLNSLIVESYLNVLTVKNTDKNSSTSAPGSLKGHDAPRISRQNDIFTFDNVDIDCEEDLSSPTTNWPLEKRKMRTNFTTDRKRLELKLDENKRVKKVSVGKLSLDNFLITDNDDNNNNNYNTDSPDWRNEDILYEEQPVRTSSWSKKDKKRSSIRKSSDKKGVSRNRSQPGSSLQKSHSYSDLVSWEKEQGTEGTPEENATRVQALAQEIDDNNGYKERSGTDAAFATPNAMLSPEKSTETSSFTKISSFQSNEPAKSPRIRKERRKTTGLMVLNETSPTDNEFNFPRSPDTDRGPSKFKRGEKKSVRRKISSIFRPKIVVETQ